MRWLQIRFHAPLASFGGEIIDDANKELKRSRSCL